MNQAIIFDNIRFWYIFYRAYIQVYFRLLFEILPAKSQISVRTFNWSPLARTPNIFDTQYKKSTTEENNHAKIWILNPSNDDIFEF